MNQESLFKYLEANFHHLEKSVSRFRGECRFELVDAVPHDQKIWFTPFPPNLAKEVIENPRGVTLEIHSKEIAGYTSGISLWLHPSGIGSYRIWGTTWRELGMQDIINKFSSEKDMLRSVLHVLNTFQKFYLESIFTRWAEAHEYVVVFKPDLIEVEIDGNSIKIEVIRYGRKSEMDENDIIKRGAPEGLTAIYPGYWWTLKREASLIAIKDLTRDKRNPEEFIKWMDENLVL